MNKSKYNNSTLKGKSKTNKSKSKYKERKVPVSESDICKASGDINDVSFYFNNPTLRDQLSNISFNEFTGIPNAVASLLDGQLEVENIPYAMRINLNPSAGFTNAEGDITMGNSLNLASLALYTKLSANNAKTTNYAPQDITMMLLALGSVMSLTGHITRAFGTSYLYNQRNRSYPRSILGVLGVDYDDLMMNFANYRARFNTIMVAASKIPIPANIPYFRKCSELYSGLYLDMGGSDMAQTYAFVPESLWNLNEADYEEGTFLQTFILNTDGPLTTVKMSILLNNLDLMINSLLSSTTLNSIYSDILRVSLKEGIQLYQFNSIPDNYVVLPTYNPEIRLWINNLTIMGAPTGNPTASYTASNHVYPDVDTNKIVYRPQFEIPQRLIAGYLEPYVNFDYGNPSNDDVILATRLTSVPSLAIIDGEIRTEAVALPDHYVTSIAIYRPDASFYFSAYTIDDYTSALLSAFDWAPMFHTINGDGALSHFMGDLNYYTTISYKYASRLHDATYLGLFEIR